MNPKQQYREAFHHLRTVKTGVLWRELDAGAPIIRTLAFWVAYHNYHDRENMRFTGWCNRARENVFKDKSPKWVIPF